MIVSNCGKTRALLFLPISLQYLLVAIAVILMRQQTHFKQFLKDLNLLISVEIAVTDHLTKSLFRVHNTPMYLESMRCPVNTNKIRLTLIHAPDDSKIHCRKPRPNSHTGTTLFQFILSVNKNMTGFMKTNRKINYYLLFKC